MYVGRNEQKRYAGCGREREREKRGVQALPAAASAAFFAAAASCSPSSKWSSVSKTMNPGAPNPGKRGGGVCVFYLFLAHNVGIGFHL